MVFSLGLLAPTCLWHRLSNGLAALHLSCLSYNPVYFGHGHPHRTHSRLAPDILHLGHQSVATFIPRSLAVHSIYFFSPLNVSLPRLRHHHAFATLHRHFLLSRLPDSTRACTKGGTRRKLSTTQTTKILSSSLALPAAYCVYDATPLPSPPSRSCLFIYRPRVQRWVLVFPPMSVFLDLGTRLVIFSSFSSTFHPRQFSFSRVFPGLSIVYFPGTRLCF